MSCIPGKPIVIPPGVGRIEVPMPKLPTPGAGMPAVGIVEPVGFMEFIMPGTPVAGNAAVVPIGFIAPVGLNSDY